MVLNGSTSCLIMGPCFCLMRVECSAYTLPTFFPLVTLWRHHFQSVPPPSREDGCELIQQIDAQAREAESVGDQINMLSKMPFCYHIHTSSVVVRLPFDAWEAQLPLWSVDRSPHYVNFRSIASQPVRLMEPWRTTFFEQRSWTFSLHLCMWRWITLCI